MAAVGGPDKSRFHRAEGQEVRLPRDRQEVGLKEVKRETFQETWPV